MQLEVESAVSYMCTHILKAHEAPSLPWSEFQKALKQVLIERYQEHWFITSPTRGSAFRCIHNCPCSTDPSLEEASQRLGSHSVAPFLSAAPQSFKIWIDPGEVSARVDPSDLLVSVYNIKRASSPITSLSSAASAASTSTSTALLNRSPTHQQQQFVGIVGGADEVHRQFSSQSPLRRQTHSSTRGSGSNSPPAQFYASTSSMSGAGAAIGRASPLRSSSPPSTFPTASAPSYIPQMMGPHVTPLNLNMHALLNQNFTNAAPSNNLFLPRNHQLRH